MNTKHEMVKKDGQKTIEVLDPFQEFFSLRSPLPRLFNDPFLGFEWPVRSPVFGAKGAWMPAIDVKETDKEYVLTSDVPGMEKKNIHVDIRNHVLSISGERKTDKEEKGKNFLRKEQSYGSFCRSVSLPADIQVSDITAAYKDGVLTLRIPRVLGAKTGSVKVDIE